MISNYCVILEILMSHPKTQNNLFKFYLNAKYVKQLEKIVQHRMSKFQNLYDILDNLDTYVDILSNFCGIRKKNLNFFKTNEKYV